MAMAHTARLAIDRLWYLVVRHHRWGGRGGLTGQGAAGLDRCRPADEAEGDGLHQAKAGKLTTLSRRTSLVTWSTPWMR